MNITRIIDSVMASILNSKQMTEDLRLKASNKNLLIGCEYNLYKSFTDLLQLQEKVEFFIESISKCSFDKTNERDFSTYIKAMEEEYNKKCEFYKKCINEDKLIK
jgi:hypothetical protein